LTPPVETNDDVEGVRAGADKAGRDRHVVVVAQLVVAAAEELDRAVGERSGVDGAVEAQQQFAGSHVEPGALFEYGSRGGDHGQQGRAVDGQQHPFFERFQTQGAFGQFFQGT
jgi:hypothetical protein